VRPQSDGRSELAEVALEAREAHVEGARARRAGQERTTAGVIYDEGNDERWDCRGVGTTVGGAHNNHALTGCGASTSMRMHAVCANTKLPASDHLRRLCSSSGSSRGVDSC